MDMSRAGPFCPLKSRCLLQTMQTSQVPQTVKRQASGASQSLKRQAVQPTRQAEVIHSRTADVLFDQPKLRKYKKRPGSFFFTLPHS